MSPTTETGKTPDPPEEPETAEPPEVPEGSDSEAMLDTVETGKRRAGRVGWNAVLAVVVVIWSVALAVAVVRRDTSGADVAAARPPTVEVPPTTDPPTAEQVADSIEIETGFTPGEVVAQRTVIGETVSYAIVLENTGDYVLHDIRLNYRFLDAQGQVIRNYEELDRLVSTVGLLRPGERVAISDVEYLERNDVTEIEVEVDRVTEWFPVDYYEHADPLVGTPQDDLIVTDVEVTYGLAGGPVVGFTVESTGEQEMTTEFAYVVFRNAAGRIVGGTYGYLNPQAHRPVTLPPGDSVEAEVQMDEPMEIPGIDPARTEIFLSNQFFPQ